MIRDLLKERNMSIYRLAKESQVPYATVNDICNQKAQLEKCSAETIYRLASALNVSIEELLEPYFTKRNALQTKRKEAIEFANAINLIEGVPLPNTVSALFDKWADEKVSHENLMETLLEMYRRPVS